MILWLSVELDGAAIGIIGRCFAIILFDSSRRSLVLQPTLAVLFKCQASALSELGPRRSGIVIAHPAIGVYLVLDAGTVSDA